MNGQLSYTEQKNIDELHSLNAIFHNKKLISSKFYDQIIGFGISISASILIDIYPDGNNIYCGRLVTNKGEEFDFDLDLDFPENSVWEKLSKKKMSKQEKIRYDLAKNMARGLKPSAPNTQSR